MVCGSMPEGDIHSAIIVEVWFCFRTVSLLISLLVDIKLLPIWMISPLSWPAKPKIILEA